MKNFYEHCDKCSECGRFMSYKTPIVSTTSFGGACDWEPPDADHYCRKCWDAIKNDPTRLRLINAISWIKPHLINRERLEYEYTV